MLSPAEAEALHRGTELKRYVRAAAALSGIYDDVALAEAVGVNRGAVGGWWTGAQMKSDTLSRLADVTGLDLDDLTHFVYFDGPPPRLLDDLALSPVREGIRRGQSHLDAEAPERQTPRPGPRPRDSGAERRR